jgi:hypothetical protein
MLKLGNGQKLVQLNPANKPLLHPAHTLGWPLLELLLFPLLQSVAAVLALTTVGTEAAEAALAIKTTTL